MSSGNLQQPRPNCSRPLRVGIHLESNTRWTCVRYTYYIYIMFNYIMFNYMMFPSYLHHIYTHRVFIIFTFIVSHWCFLTFKVCISMCTTYCDLNLPRFSGLPPASHWVFCMSSGPAMALPPAIQHPQVRRKRRDFEKRQHVELRAPVLRCVDWDGFVILRC